MKKNIFIILYYFYDSTKHPIEFKKSAEEQPLSDLGVLFGEVEVDAKERTRQTASEDDYIFNYHWAKFEFGLVLLEFNDSLKEGDGQRLYKLCLLLFKHTSH